MKRQQEEELRRLEQALLEDIPEEDLPPEEDPLEWVDAFCEEFYDDADEPLPPGFTVHNTDDVDVDLEDYSEEVYRGNDRRPAFGVLVALTVFLLLVVIFCLVKLLGVI